MTQQASQLSDAAARIASAQVRIAELARAIWHQNSQSTMILKCCVKDGGAVLAAIEKVHHFKWHWSAGSHIGVVKTRHTAMRRARAAARAALAARAGAGVQ
jgi:hypothetical protein